LSSAHWGNPYSSLAIQSTVELSTSSSQAAATGVDDLSRIQFGHNVILSTAFREPTSRPASSPRQTHGLLLPTPRARRRDEAMSQRRLPQADLFKTHKLTSTQRTTAVALLKAPLIEAISAQTSAAAVAERSTAEGNDVEIGKDVGE